MPALRWTMPRSRADAKPLQGMRIAILREHMVKRDARTTRRSPTRSTAEIKTVLRDRLGAEMVETITPAYPDDPDVPNLHVHASRTRSRNCCRG